MSKRQDKLAARMKPNHGQLWAQVNDPSRVLLTREIAGKDRCLRCGERYDDCAGSPCIGDKS